jgi:glycosyltransferase involved in cell wall biosynthesis
LRPAIDSVFAQTFRDWELIVVDDGSDGETAAYLEALAGSPRVTVIRLPHTGNPGAVRNAGWRAARGEYIAFLDSDDLWLPHKLAAQLASLAAHPERGWSHTAFALIDSSGELLTGESARAWPSAEGWILEGLIKMQIVIAPATVVVRRELLERLGGFDVGQRVCEDYDLWLRLSGLSEIDGIREALVLKRSQPEPFYHPCMVPEDLGRALEKLLASGCDRRLRFAVDRERAKAAVALAHSQAVYGGRRAALRTLLRSSLYSWAYLEWWLRGARAAARAVAPAGMVRLVRLMTRRAGTARVVQP